MKKSIFILAALFAATFANAQITLEKEIEGYAFAGSPTTVLWDAYGGDIVGVVNYANNTTTILDAYSYEEIATYGYLSWFVAARGYFTNTNEVIVLTSTEDKHVVLLNESGEVIQDLGEGFSSGLYPRISEWPDGSYRLFVGFYIDGKSTTRIYSLPGNGQATEISSPSSSKRSARKIANKGNVLVETDNNTYTLTGQQVK